MAESLAFHQRHLITMEGLSRDEIEAILAVARSFRELNERDIKKSPSLRGRTVINLFFENSTRTRSSFEIAGKRLSADVINISASGSSTTKGETLLDTAANLQAMVPDVVVVRHAQGGACEFLTRHLECSIVNAGDGRHEHPTQALLDLLTMHDHIGDWADKTIAIVGDVTHSRVARSNLIALKTLGAHTRVVAPPTLLPRDVQNYGCEVHYDLERGIAGADVVMVLRLQRERMQGSFIPSINEYFNMYGINRDRLHRMAPGALVMHPGPINRGVELASDAADGPESLVLEQVKNGVAVRMAVLHLLGQGTGI
ncbi:MAG: aspartate carbamoyltransferase catalytic subunit [Alphaproteobacteria bacterium CG_4_10_14_0_2_um_filter_63_37]|nr:MAG: aspartate carbamoyltransferase [Proteobacteria bacterium CG1_02_64_396]PJA24871.1 MAG: aspartate carbamoyltransferase catalytic subunit [Alphaproteobacteria bacterium CG_4_10_14_0_2_um_filter_63_37]